MLPAVVMTTILVFGCCAGMEKCRLFLRKKLRMDAIFDILEKRIISAVYCVELKIKNRV